MDQQRQGGWFQERLQRLNTGLGKAGRGFVVGTPTSAISRPDWSSVSRPSPTSPRGSITSRPRIRMAGIRKPNRKKNMTFLSRTDSQLGKISWAKGSWSRGMETNKMFHHDSWRRRYISNGRPVILISWYFTPGIWRGAARAALDWSNAGILRSA